MKVDVPFNKEIKPKPNQTKPNQTIVLKNLEFFRLLLFLISLGDLFQKYFLKI